MRVCACVRACRQSTCDCHDIAVSEQNMSMLDNAIANGLLICKLALPGCRQLHSILQQLETYQRIAEMEAMVCEILEEF